jgi:hypothetical protein
MICPSGALTESIFEQAALLLLKLIADFGNDAFVDTVTEICILAKVRCPPMTTSSLY